MSRLLFIFCVLLATSAPAQDNPSVTVLDFVKIKNNKRAEVIYYYENNWKLYRDIAMQKGYIRSYKLMNNLNDSISQFDLLLITEYADSAQYKLSEEHFGAIIKEVRPTGPKLLNELKPADFRQNIFSTQAETMFNSEKRKKGKGLFN